MPKMNVRLLRKIQGHILEEPKRFIMADVIDRAQPGERVEDYGLEWAMPKCGTTACIAGWALLLSNSYSYDMHQAAGLLGLEYDASDTLFYVGGWPPNYQTQWGAAKTPRMRARVAVRRIDHFIKTKGAE